MKKFVIPIILIPAMLIYLTLGIFAACENNTVKVYRYKKNENKEIALTFDDGPHPVYTTKILDILEKYNVKATFFMVGENILNYTETAQKVKEAGHEIGNHTETHKSDLNEKQLMREIMNCSEIIFNTLDYESSIIRPPEGLIRDSTLRCCSLLEYSIILWNIDTRDWAHTSPEKIYKNVMKNIDSGDIILMHDYINRKSPTPEALEMFLPKLIEEGYKFVTVSELIGNTDVDKKGSAPSFKSILPEKHPYNKKVGFM